jgi:hypothetical protein
MISNPEYILKELYPKFPEWSPDFGRFLGLSYPDILVSESDEQNIWALIENIYATVLESMISLSGVSDLLLGGIPDLTAGVGPGKRSEAQDFCFWEIKK